MKTSGMQINVLDEPLDIWNEVRRNPIEEESVHLCDLTDVIRKYQNWTTLLPRVVPFYAVKANDSLNVLGVLAALGTGFDCASKREIESVLGMGVSSSRIIFANPAKSAFHIEYASKNGVNIMTFDNAIEIHKIKAIAPNTKLVMRIRCDAKDSLIRLGDKFGCDPELDAPVLLALAKDIGMEVIGVSFHVGTGCMDSPIYAKAIQHSKKIFDLAKQLGINLTLLDLGGGFMGGKQHSLVECARIINAALDTHFPDGTDVKIIAEPGRYFVSTCSTLMTQIHSKKCVSNNDGLEKIMYYINDGVYGSLSNVIYENQQLIPIILRSSDNGDRLISTSIWGPTCDSMDKVIDNVMMPEMHVGDLIAFEETGAYSKTVTTGFNGIERPKSRYFIERNTVFKMDCPALDKMCKN